MKRKFKWITLFLSAVIITISLSACGKTADWDTDKTGHPKLVMKDGVNINPPINTNKQFEKAIKHYYPNLDKSNTQANDHYNFVIPGLEKTTSLKNDGQNKTIGTSTQMDPQGLAITDKYVIISAYSRGHKYNSVLYFLDKKTGKYLKHFVLPDAAHVGGIAFDEKNKNLWITTYTNHHASISSLTKANLEQKDFSQTKKAVTFKLTIEVPAIKRASFMGYNNNSLYIGYFDQESHGYLTKVELDASGIPDFKTETNKDFLNNEGQKYTYTLSQTKKVATADKLQGITFYKDTFLFSKSYGDKSSELLQFDDDLNDPNFRSNKVLETVKFPPYMEQIVVQGPYLYVLFESGADYFRDRNLDIVGDHLLRLNLKTLLKTN